MKNLVIAFLLVLMLAFSGCTAIKNWFMPAENVSYITFEEIPTEEIPLEEILEEEVVEEEEIEEEIEEVEEEIVEEEPAEILEIKATEGDLVTLESITSRFSDPEGDELEFTYSEPFDENGKWQTDRGDAGEKTVTITASDGVNDVSVDVKIIIELLDKPPVLEVIKDVVVDEGDTVSFDPKALDPEGKPLTITYSGWMTTSSYKTTYDDAGEYTVTITVSDGVNEVSQDAEVTINDVNRAPVFK